MAVTIDGSYTRRPMGEHYPASAKGTDEPESEPVESRYTLAEWDAICAFDPWLAMRLLRRGVA